MANRAVKWGLRTLIGAVVLVVGLAGAAAGLWWWVGQAGSTSVEQWAGLWLKQRIEANIDLKLHFEQLDYEHPFTLRLQNLRLEAPDSRAEGATIDIVATERAELTLAEIPEAGKPLLIEKLRIERPEVRLIEDPDGFGFIGFNQLGAAEATADVAADDDNEEGSGPTEEEVAAATASAKSLPVQLRRLEITEGFVSYLTDQPDAEPILVSGITAASDLEEEGQDVYGYTLEIRREPELVVEHAGRIDVPNLVLDIKKFTADLKLDGAGDPTFPESLKQLLRQKRVRGTYGLRVSGKLPIDQPRDATLQMSATIDDGYLRHSGWNYPVNTFRFSGNLRNKIFQIDGLSLRALNGLITAGGQITLDENLNAILNLQTVGVEAGQLREDSLGAVRQKYRGKIDADIIWSGALRYAAVDSNGRGNLKLYEGRLADVPFLTEIGDMIDEMAGPNRRGRDVVEVDMIFRRTHAFLRNFTATSGPVKAIGQGRVFFDGRLNLLFRAGPLERIGVTGGVLPQYRFSGTFKDNSLRLVGSKARLDDE
ncbi:MAG: hypothetical protein AAGH99_05505 [Planctomycetota bacterium]